MTSPDTAREALAAGTYTLAQPCVICATDDGGNEIEIDVQGDEITATFF